MAARDRSLRASVLSSTRVMPRVSKQWVSCRYLASVLTRVRCHSGTIQVPPISTVGVVGSTRRIDVLPANRRSGPAHVAKTAADSFARIPSAIAKKRSTSSRPCMG